MYRPSSDNGFRRAAIIYPHQCEFLAAKVVGRGVARYFREKNLQVESVTIPGMMRRAPKMRLVMESIHDKEPDLKEVHPREILEDCDLLLTYEDVAIRAAAVSRAIASNKNGFCVLEIHAMSAMNENDAVGTTAREYSRIEGTGLLVGPLFAMFTNVLEDVVKTMAQNAIVFGSQEMTCGEVMTRIARHYGFNLTAAITTIRQTVEVLSQTSNFGLVVEVPSTPIPLQQNHPNYSFYQGLDGRAPLMLAEKDYCMCLRKGVEIDYRVANALGSILLQHQSGVQIY